MRVELDEPECVAFLLTEQPEARRLDDVREAAAICPAAAIRLLES
jgi:ferredoxin